MAEKGPEQKPDHIPPPHSVWELAVDDVYTDKDGHILQVVKAPNDRSGKPRNPKSFFELRDEASEIHRVMAKTLQAEFDALHGKQPNASPELTPEQPAPKPQTQEPTPPPPEPSTEPPASPAAKDEPALPAESPSTPAPEQPQENTAPDKPLTESPRKALFEHLTATGQLRKGVILEDRDETRFVIEQIVEPSAKTPERTFMVRRLRPQGGSQRIPEADIQQWLNEHQFTRVERSKKPGGRAGAARPEPEVAEVVPEAVETPLQKLLNPGETFVDGDITWRVSRVDKNKVGPTQYLTYYCQPIKEGGEDIQGKGISQTFSHEELSRILASSQAKETATPEPTSEPPEAEYVKEFLPMLSDESRRRLDESRLAYARALVSGKKIEETRQQYLTAKQASVAELYNQFLEQAKGGGLKPEDAERFYIAIALGEIAKLTTDTATVREEQTPRFKKWKEFWRSERGRKLRMTCSYALLAVGASTVAGGGVTAGALALRAILASAGMADAVHQIMEAHDQQKSSQVERDDPTRKLLRNVLRAESGLSATEIHQIEEQLAQSSTQESLSDLRRAIKGGDGPLRIEVKAEHLLQVLQDTSRYFTQLLGQLEAERGQEVGQARKRLAVSLGVGVAAAFGIGALGAQGQPQGLANLAARSSGGVFGGWLGRLFGRKVSKSPVGELVGGITGAIGGGLAAGVAAGTLEHGATVQHATIAHPEQPAAPQAPSVAEGAHAEPTTPTAPEHAAAEPKLNIPGEHVIKGTAENGVVEWGGHQFEVKDGVAQNVGLDLDMDGKVGPHDIHTAIKIDFKTGEGILSSDIHDESGKLMYKAGTHVQVLDKHWFGEQGKDIDLVARANVMKDLDGDGKLDVQVGFAADGHLRWSHQEAVHAQWNVSDKDANFFVKDGVVNNFDTAHPIDFLGFATTGDDAHAIAQELAQQYAALHYPEGNVTQMQSHIEAALNQGQGAQWLQEHLAKHDQAWGGAQMHALVHEKIAEETQTAPANSIEGFLKDHEQTFAGLNQVKVSETSLQPFRDILEGKAAGTNIQMIDGGNQTALKEALESNRLSAENTTLFATGDGKALAIAIQQPDGSFLSAKFLKP